MPSRWSRAPISTIAGWASASAAKILRSSSSAPIEHMFAITGGDVQRPAGQRLGAKPVLLLGCLALLAVVGLSALVGCVGSRDDGFDWELAGIFGTALGTTLLAITTGLLAWLTWGDVRATQDLALATR